MGFKIPERTAVLTFKGSAYEGAEVRVRLNVPLQVFFDLASQEGLQAFQPFGDAVLSSWNLETAEGRPIPATGKGMLTLPLDFGLWLIRAWVKEVSTLSTPLVEPSDNGAMSEVPMTGLADASRSLGPLSGPKL